MMSFFLARRHKLSFDALIKLADAARGRCDWGGAASLYEVALVLNPEVASIQIQCGHMCKEAGRLAEAEAHYLAAHKLVPNDPDLNLQIGHFYKVAEREREAVDFYQRAYELAPDLTDAKVELAALNSTRHWEQRFNVLEFRMLNRKLAAGVTTRAEALGRFLSEGVQQMAPIAFDARFEPDFYRTRYPELRALSDPDLYRNWLFTGIPKGHAGSPVELLAQLGCTDYPAAFDWKAYRSETLNDDNSFVRYTKLEDLFEVGFVSGSPVPTSGRGEAELFERLARFLLGRGNVTAAIRAMEKAVEHDPRNGAFRHALADYYLKDKRNEEAAGNYAQAYDYGSRQLWTCVHVIEDSIRGGNFEQAYGVLRTSRDKHCGEMAWRRALHAAAEADFSAAWEAAQEHQRDNRCDLADQRLLDTLQRIHDVYVELDDLPGRLPEALDGHIVMFSLTTVLQCRHYRVEQRLEQFAHLQIPVRAFDGTQPSEAREALIGARALIIYREPALPSTIRLVLHAQAMGVPVIYEIDDLLFDRAHYPGPFQPTEQATYEQYIGIVTGVVSYRFIIKLCDLAIASTDQLATHLAPLTKRKKSLVLYNGLDSRNDGFAKDPIPSRDPNAEVLIFYGSGAKVHNRNFNTTVAPALVAVLAQRPNVKLLIAGFLDPSSALSDFGDRIVRLPFTKDVRAYWSILRETDINLAVLTPGEMNDCKSEIKWLEAAVCGVPSIVSASATYRGVLNDGSDALLVDDGGDWKGALLSLVDHPDKRRDMGIRARRHALNAYALPVLAERLGRDLAVLHQEREQNARRRTRILVVHVLFPPQAFGGATRVVVDNIDDLVRRHGDDFDLAIFTSDLHAPNPKTRVGHYGTVPVFRFAVSYHGSEVYEDESIAPFFQDVLDAFRPDIVHFHCIQILTATIVEITKRREIPYMVTLHDGWWLSSNQFMLDSDFFLRRTPMRVIEEAYDAEQLPFEARRRHSLMNLLGGAALVTAVSDGFAAYYRERTNVAIRTISNGVSPEFKDRGGRRKPPRGEGPVRIGHLGGWAPHKGIHLLRAALTMHPFENLDVTVVDHRRNAGETEEQRWGTVPVHVIGKVPQTEMVDIYDHLDVLLAPSIWPESYGLITREALACGLWVVSGGLGGIGDDVLEGQNGFIIDTETPDGLLGALRKIDADPELFRRPPAMPSTPRLSFMQADELAAAYREIRKRSASVTVETRG